MREAGAGAQREVGAGARRSRRIELTEGDVNFKHFSLRLTQRQMHFYSIRFYLI